MASSFAALLFCANCVASYQMPGDDATRRELDSLLERYARCGWSGAALVARDGEPLLARGYGLADREAGRPNDERTLFEIASITKQFTAAAILELEEQGRLSTEDFIADHLPGVPQHSRKITIHHLLTHTSGIPASNARGSGDDLERAVADYMGDGPKRVPGTNFEYWNGGYALVAGIVERASGRSFHGVLSRASFRASGDERHRLHRRRTP